MRAAENVGRFTYLDIAACLIGFSQVSRVR